MSRAPCFIRTAARRRRPDMKKAAPSSRLCRPMQSDQRRRRTRTGTRFCEGAVAAAKKSMTAEREPAIRKSTSAISTCETNPVIAVSAVKKAKIQKARRATERVIGHLSQVFLKTYGQEAGSMRRKACGITIEWEMNTARSGGTLQSRLALLLHRRLIVDCKLAR